jgi:hypothetical protein
MSSSIYARSKSRDNVDPSFGQRRTQLPGNIGSVARAVARTHDGDSGAIVEPFRALAKDDWRWIWVVAQRIRIIRVAEWQHRCAPASMAL